MLIEKERHRNCTVIICEDDETGEVDISWYDNEKHPKLIITDMAEDADPEEEKEYFDDYDFCYECGGYGDNYSINEKGELVRNCDDCPFNVKWEVDP